MDIHNSMSHYHVTNIRPDARGVLATDFAAEGTSLRLCHVRLADLRSIVTVHNTGKVGCGSCLSRFNLVPT